MQLLSFILLPLFLLASCEQVIDSGKDISLKPVPWSYIPEIKQDNIEQALPALQKTCALFLLRDSARNLASKADVWGNYGHWHPFCRDIMVDDPTINLLAVVNKHLTPYQVQSRGFWPKNKGLFTGYYEPIIEGSLDRSDIYNTPLYSRPIDVVTADLGLFSDDFSGRRLVARVNNGKLIPYYTRADIVKGALSEDDILLWLKDPVDSFFLQIQGSGRVTLPDGQQLFVGYDGVNGHSYTPIGRYMVKQGWLKKGEVSMQSIRAWLEANPDHLDDVLQKNNSYVFFKLRKDGPYGTQGVVLTPQRSLAVDRKNIPLGVPLFVDTVHTADNTGWHKLMVAQDTGGAIKGAIRGDIFFGNTPQALESAGKQNSRGQFFVLLPKIISATNKGL